jgi:predicted DNA-binding WGR domain protein
MKRLEYVEGSSSKFWEITVSGKTVKTRWGRIGADGQGKETEFASPALAKSTAEKQIAEKLSKGYAEAGATKTKASSAKPPATKTKASAVKPAATKTKASSAKPAAADETPGKGIKPGIFPPADATVAIPSVLRALVEMTWRTKNQIEEVRDVIGADLDGFTLAQVVENPYVGRGGPGVLEFGWVPFEVIPFAWQGGDSLHYGHLVLAEELGATDWPAVSYAPCDDGVRWLGDDTREALANLIATEGKFAALDAKENDEDPEDVRWYARQRARTARELGLPPGQALTRGARSNRAPKPEVPKDYRYVTAKNNVGILAPAKFFDMNLDVNAIAVDDLEGKAKQLLCDGYPASALELMRILRLREYYDKSGEMVACEQMVSIFEAMGRPIMARRVELHIRAMREK